jgi:SRSO17 transposase
LYLPGEWAEDTERREKTEVPKEVEFQTRPEIALDQIRAAVAASPDRGVVLADAAYGINTEFRDGVAELDLQYVAGVQSSMTVWEPGKQPLPAKPRGKMGRPPRLEQRTTDHQPVSVKQLAMSLPSRAFREITWREGSDRKLRSRLAAVRVRATHRDYWKAEPHAEEWLPIEWPRGEKEPAKCRVSTLPPATALKALIKMAKHRWIIERDYEELKQEPGLGHFEGRNWRGFPHHATLCIAAYGFPAGERNRFSPLPAPVILDSLPPGQRRTSGRGARRVRPERHNPCSIATIRIAIARELLKRLPQCPFCGSRSG